VFLQTVYFLHSKHRLYTSITVGNNEVPIFILLYIQSSIDIYICNLIMFLFPSTNK
jgi:hypothetical protein